MSHTPHVLIVDDEPAGRETIAALLVAEDYDLAFAGSGAEALEHAAAFTPDVILLDVMMPGLDGFEVCRRLRADPRLAEVPIIMVTALDDHDSRLQGIESGADDFVSKPFDRAELRARVRTITRLNRYRRLLAERAKFKWAVDHSSDGYLIVDERDGVVYANAQARLYLGLPEDENSPIESAFLDLARARYRCEPESAWAAWAESFDEQQPHYLVRPESPTAQAFWLHVDALELPSGAGRIVRLRDVTLHIMLRRNTWEFHSLVSHKLRTSLSGVLTGLELIEQDLPGTLDAGMTELFEMTLQSARHLRGEVNDIFEYLTVPQLAQPGVGVPVSQLRPIVARLSTRLKLQDVTMTVPEDLNDVQVLLSQPAIELVLGELLENARKFHPRQEPAVDIRVSRSSATLVIVRISDDGLTLSPEQLARAWVPYYQGEKYFTGQVLGMGLGLPMVAVLVWSAGGKCGIANREDGPGVIVEVGLPVAENSFLARPPHDVTLTT